MMPFIVAAIVIAAYFIGMFMGVTLAKEIDHDRHL
jgi:flagellar biosynthesis protein FliR